MDFDAKQFPEDFRDVPGKHCARIHHMVMCHVFSLCFRLVICQIYLIRQNRELLYFKNQN